MQDRYIADEAKVNISSLEAETVMKSTPVSTVTSILGRIGIEYEEGLPKEAYIAAFKEELVDLLGHFFRDHYPFIQSFSLFSAEDYAQDLADGSLGESCC